MWMMAAVNIVGSILGFLGANDAAKAQMIIAKANADAENTIRKGKNAYEGAKASLSNYLRAEDTKAKFKAAGEEYNAINQNMMRARDQYIKGSVMERLAASEQLGALAAQASFMGIGGATVDNINSQIKMASQDAQDENALAMQYQEIDMRQGRNNLMYAAASSSDFGTTFANMDYGKSVPAYVAKPSFLSYALQGIGNALPYIRVGIGQSQMNKYKQEQQQNEKQYGSRWQV